MTQTTKSGSTYTHGYRPDGLRQFRQKVNNSVTSKTEYLYDGQMPVIEKDYEGGTLKKTRVSMPGMRGIEAVTTITEPTDSNSSATVDNNWLWYDGHGNCVRSENNSSTLSGWQWRDAWGNNDPVPVTSGSSNVKDKGYCANLGHIEDDSGLTYMRARYYDPGIGRFISEDPKRVGVNWFTYARCNPVTNVDFTGLEPFDWEFFFWRLADMSRWGSDYVISYINLMIDAVEMVKKDHLEKAAWWSGLAAGTSGTGSMEMVDIMEGEAAKNKALSFVDQVVIYQLTMLKWMLENNIWWT